MTCFAIWRINFAVRRISFAIWPVIRLCAILIIGLVEGTAGYAATNAPDTPPSVLVKTTPVRLQQVTETLSAFGTLEPDPDKVLSLSLPHAGLINRVWVRLGVRVKTGDRLVEIITAPDARMQYLQAQSAVTFARRAFERQKHLLKKQLTTKSQYDGAKKALEDAMATLTSLRQRGQGVDREILRAPMAGIITRLDVSQGQRVQADSTAMLIAAEKQLVARLGIEPEDLPVLKPGTPVSITSVFVPQLLISSKIREIHAMIDPTTRLVGVLAPIENVTSDKLILGSRILGKIQIASRKALVVPHSAVLTGDNQSYVFIVRNNKARRVNVKTGIQQRDLIEVSGTLQAGDLVVITGNYELQDGMAVRETP